MHYDIIVRFPNEKLAEEFEKLAEEFCGQMSDGFGEGFCNFSPHRQKRGTTGKYSSDYERVTDSAPEGTKVFFVEEIFDF